jgi:hypothetical protein
MCERFSFIIKLPFAQNSDHPIRMPPNRSELWGTEFAEYGTTRLWNRVVEHSSNPKMPI